MDWMDTRRCDVSVYTVEEEWDCSIEGAEIKIDLVWSVALGYTRSFELLLVYCSFDSLIMLCLTRGAVVKIALPFLFLFYKIVINNIKTMKNTMEDLETSESTVENILEQQDEELALLKKRVDILERVVALILEDNLDITTKRFIAEKWRERLTKRSN